MKLLLLSFTAFCISQLVMGQAGGSVGTGGSIVLSTVRPPTYLREVMRNLEKPTYRADISGSPFIYENWLLASIKLADDRFFDSVYIKLNVYKDKVHFMGDNGEEMEVTIRVKEIRIIDAASSWFGAIFRTGYSGAGGIFFQVLEDGKNIQLLKKIKVTVWETKALGEEDRKSFQLEEEAVFAINNEIYKQNKLCNKIAESVEKYEEKLRQFIADNNIRCNKEADMRKLVIFFNSL